MGLDEFLFNANQQLFEPHLFFENINAVLKRLKQTKSIIYFLGKGASAAFANHMALDLAKN